VVQATYREDETVEMPNELRLRNFGSGKKGKRDGREWCWIPMSYCQNVKVTIDWGGGEDLSAWMFDILATN
jgi:hypothetical protein